MARSPGAKPDALKCSGAAQAHRVGRSGDELGREPGALEREGRVDPQVAVDLARLLELERARDVGAHPAAIPAVEGALVHHHHREVLGVGGLGAILVLDPEHARHRGGVGLPEPDPAAIVGRQHEHSVGQARRLAWAILAPPRLPRTPFTLDDVGFGASSTLAGLWKRLGLEHGPSRELFGSVVAEPL